MPVYSRVSSARVDRSPHLCFVPELLIYYKQNDHDMDYQDCYGVYIKIQDLIENFNESLVLLVRYALSRIDF